jgi:hypothetical protein
MPGMYTMIALSKTPVGLILNFACRTGGAKGVSSHVHR